VQDIFFWAKSFGADTLYAAIIHRELSSVMDLITLAYYGAICGALGYAGPALGRWFPRLLFGVCTGLIAATLLPFVESYFSGGP